ncbi:hypothetical protein AAG906_002601 [Vitis piasezkii]
MGRRKLSIRRLQSGRERQAKYSQRKQGILRKANDLAVLCDTDVLLLMFSPTGKPCLTVGQNKNLLTVMERLASLSVDYREERAAYTLELLAKMHRRLNSDVDQKNFSLDSNEILQLKRYELEQLRSQLAEKSKAMRDWKFPSTVNDLGQIRRMENSLSELMVRVRAKRGISRARGAAGVKSSMKPFSQELIQRMNVAVTLKHQQE